MRKDAKAKEAELGAKESEAQAARDKLEAANKRMENRLKKVLQARSGERYWAELLPGIFGNLHLIGSRTIFASSALRFVRPSSCLEGSLQRLPWLYLRCPGPRGVPPCEAKMSPRLVPCQGSTACE